MDIAPTLPELTDILTDPELFSGLDHHFALFMARLAKKHGPAAALAAALVSRKTGAGNICLDLAEYAGKPLYTNSGNIAAASLICPSLPGWKEQLMDSGVVGTDEEGATPLVLDAGNRLYLRRYWQYEKTIIQFIRQRGVPFFGDLNLPRLGTDLQKLFPARPGGEVDWQQVAALAAATRLFSVISGGPGTGKTTTVAKILALLQKQYSAGKQPRILLGAPTGKAASRLQQAIAAANLFRNNGEPLQATTLHRMLGYIPDSPYFRHNADNPLAADIIVIDEVSMVDLPLLAKLMQAVPAAARLILLGDRHQLASVQPGSVLGDICPAADAMTDFSPAFCRLSAELTGNSLAAAPPAGAKNSSSSLRDSFVELVQSHRFSPESSIARLSRAVRLGDGDGALAVLRQTRDDSITWSKIPRAAELGGKLRESPYFSLYAAMQQAPEPDSCFALLDDLRILCALRSGPFGMERINDIFARQIGPQFQAGLPENLAALSRHEGISLRFRPVMVTRNDYNLQLFNGDVGILLPDPENNQSLRAFFRTRDNMLRDIAPSLLPGHETVFAMTVHKSQGSEFNRILLILPDRDSPLLTRELLYTAITRARKKVDIWGRKEIFLSAVQRKIKRSSGLAAGLWGEAI